MRVRRMLARTMCQDALLVSELWYSDISPNIDCLAQPAWILANLTHETVVAFYFFQLFQYLGQNAKTPFSTTIDGSAQPHY